MKNSAGPASLIPLSVIAFGLDLIAGSPVLHIIQNTLSQNGF